MKKVLSTILALIIIFNIIPPATMAILQDGESYEGTATYKDIYTNINFSDINNHWAKESILRVAGLSIIRGIGGGRFSPEDTLTREGTIALLVRMMGLEAEAQQAGEALTVNMDTGAYKVLGSDDYWGLGYIQVAINEGIISPEEVNNITNLTEVTQEAIDEEVENAMTSYEDNENLNPNQLRNIEAQLRQRSEGRYTWKRPVSREQVAVWVARAMELEPIYGAEQQKVYTMKDWKDISTSNIPLVEAILQQGVMAGDDKGTFRPKASITRGEIARLMDNIHEDFLMDRGYTIGTGLVENIETIDTLIQNISVKRKAMLVRNQDNTLSTLYSQISENGTHETGFVGLKNKKLILPDKIKTFDYIKYIVDPTGNLIFVEVLTNEEMVAEGFVEEVDKDNMILWFSDYDDNLYNLPISLGADVRINDIGATINDLLYGQEVMLKINNGNIVSIQGFLDTGEAGYIHPGERIHIGKVLYKGKDSLTISDNDKEIEYIIDPATPVIKDGQSTTLSAIREGDVVRLEFDNYQGDTPFRIYVAHPDKQIQNLIKGTLNRVNTTRNEMLLTDLSYYDNGKWSSKSGDMKLSISSGADIYYDGRKIQKEHLNSYSGREVYIATDNNFSKEEAIKVVLKSGYEKRYYNSIQSIAFGDSKLRVDYNEMYFDESTIIVKDGRLIDPYNLQRDDDVLVIAQGSDSSQAAFISVESIPSIGTLVYRGIIDEIYQYSFDIDNYDILEDNEWDYSSRPTELNISEDTRIIDTRDDDIREVTVEEFTNSRFVNNKRRYDNYYDEYAYVIRDGDMVLAIDIIDKDKEGQVISTANLKDINRREDIIVLKNVRDWNDFSDRWNINSSTIDLEIKDAIIIKNGKAVTLNQLMPEDELYVIRRNDVGYIVMVR